jgi:hypothetical protein
MRHILCQCGPRTNMFKKPLKAASAENAVFTNP